MSGGCDRAGLAASPPWHSGHFVPFYRNRRVGEEYVRAIPAAAGGMRLEVETSLALEDFRLSQSVIAVFDRAMRPEWCSITARIGRRETKLEIQVEEERVVSRSRCDGESLARTGRLAHRPMLLVDNCFALHGLAALVAARAGGEELFTSIPACENLAVTAPGLTTVLLGGEEYEPPTLTLHLAPGLFEHVWIRGDRVDRLAIPRAQIRVDWVCDDAGKGEHS